ncbi:MAG: polyprenyl synthetase family protein [Candidatus Nanohalobium sp.]
MSDDFQLSRRKSQITGRLDELEEKEDFEAEWSEETIHNLVDLAKKGKMLRGSLLLEACEALDGPEPVNYATAIELIHTGLLVHDDIIDEDDERRGVETIHSRYGERGERFGEGVAICSGDITFFLALDLIADSGEQSDRALQAISECFIRTGLGEIMDVETP